MALGPSVDLIEKEYRLPSFFEIFPCLGDNFYHVFFFCENGREVVKLRIERVRDHPSKTRLSTTRRPPEEDGGHTTCLDKLSDWFSFTDKVRLPDEIIEPLRSEEGGKGSDVFFEK